MFSSQNSQVSNDANYIEDVFSTYLYTGNSSTQTINNGIDLAGKGGMTWLKCRNNTFYNSLYDTVRGATKVLYSNDTLAEQTYSGVTSFDSTGFTLGSTAGNNGSPYLFTSWTFRKQKKFFDVVTYTGTGSAVTVNHNLGSTPGCIIIKATSNTGNWPVWHRSVVDGSGYGYLVLNSTDAAAGGKIINSTSSTNFVVASGLSDVGYTYVCYVLAHNAGGFGLTGTDNVISCGSFTTDGSGNFSVNLGYEPQWILLKSTNDGTEGWHLYDNMRGLVTQPNSGTARLVANTSAAENSTTNDLGTTSTGFNSIGNFRTSNTYIYIAIRRGPMKVPTDATKVFYPNAVSQADLPDSSGVPFPPDLVNTFSRDGVDRFQSNLFNFVDRLRGLGTPNNTYTASGPALTSSSTGAESSAFPYVQLKADSQNITRGSGWNSASYGNWIDYFWRRAPSFFDEVCYTGNGSTQDITHNLGVAPELMIVKMRSATSSVGWIVYAAPLANASTSYLVLNSTDAVGTGNTVIWNSTAPTSSVFSLGASSNINTNGATNVAYLFATCAGVSKVGSYTGTGTTLQVNCGFTAGSRFVLIKRTDSTGSWYVWDVARGISSGNDPYLLLNSTAAEVTNTDYIDAYSAGFEISSTAPAEINASGGTFIYLSIA